MNDPEVTMLDTLPGNGLIARSTALEAAGLALALARRVPAPSGFRPLDGWVGIQNSKFKTQNWRGSGRGGG